MSIYDQSGQAYRITGAVGTVDNSRRERRPTTSDYAIGGARSGQWKLGRSPGFGKGRMDITGPRKKRREKAPRAHRRSSR